MPIDIISECLQFLLLFLQLAKDHADGLHPLQLALCPIQPGQEFLLSSIELLAVLHTSVEPGLSLLGNLFYLLPGLLHGIKILLDARSISLGGLAHHILTPVEYHDNLMLLAHHLFVDGLELSHLLHESGPVS